MTAKQFFKSTSFKCIAVLLSIMLICGILLTFCNAIFKVTEQDLRERAISAIYGRDVDASEEDITSRTTEYTYSTISEAYFVQFTDDEGKQVYNYLVKATGKGGFGGDVGCYVAVNLADDKKTITNIYSVQIISAEASGESFLGEISSSELAQISDIEYTDGFVYELGWINGGTTPGKDYIATGASATMRAVSNAINGAINLVKEITTGAVTEEPEPPEEPTVYDDFEYADFIDKKTTTHEVNADGSVTYHLVINAIQYTNQFKFDVTVSADKKVTAIAMTDDGSTPPFTGLDFTAALDGIVGMDLDGVKAKFTDDTFTPNTEVGTIFSGASLSGTAAYRAAAFALANYDAALASAWEYADFVDATATTYTVADGTVSYSIKVNPIQYTNAFVINVTVSADKKIASIAMTEDGSTPPFTGLDFTAALGGVVGMDLDGVKAMFTDDTFTPNTEVGTIFSGASLSGTAVYRAAAYALANYDLAIILGGNA